MSGILELFIEKLRSNIGSKMSELHLKKVDSDTYIYVNGEVVFLVRGVRDEGAYCIQIIDPNYSMFQGWYAKVCVSSDFECNLDKVRVIHIVDRGHHSEHWKRLVELTDMIGRIVNNVVFDTYEEYAKIKAEKK